MVTEPHKLEVPLGAWAVGEVWYELNFFQRLLLDHSRRYQLKIAHRIEDRVQAELRGELLFRGDPDLGEV